MNLGIAIGTSDFREIRENQLYYIDKTHLIAELLANQSKVVLLPRPRRFGKTLNLSMLQCFFDQTQQSHPLFEGLAIAENLEAMAHLNAYPTIFLTFTGIDCLDWASCEAGLKGKIGQLVGSCLTTLHAAANPVQREVVDLLHACKADWFATCQALALVIELLAKAIGKRVIVLIDEYDKLILDGKANGYFPQITSFMRNLLGSALKDNSNLQRAVITGILRIAKESIYSGLNNLSVYSFRDPEFSTCFGFTEAEVHQILSDTHQLGKEAGVKAWYNGYTFGEGTTIYNPWSILNYVSRTSKRLRPFWINTSDNQLIRDLIQNEAVLSLDELETLLSGGTVQKDIQEDIAFADMNPNTAWSLMLFTGYLTARNPELDDRADLAIPNREVHQFFSQTVAAWLGGATAVRKLADQLLAEDLERFASGLAEMVTTILSYHDTGGKRPERVYHVFMLGLLAHLQDRYRVDSNRQSGHGRADLSLIPRKPGKTGFIFEFKASPSHKALESNAQAALAQMQHQDYLTSQREAGVKRIIAIGLAFHAKRIALSCQTYEENRDPSEPRTYSAGEKQQTPSSNRQKTNPKPNGTQETNPKEPISEQTQKKLLLIGQIQLLQKQQGQPVMDIEQLKPWDLKVLSAMVESLQQ